MFAIAAFRATLRRTSSPPRYASVVSTKARRLLRNAARRVLRLEGLEARNLLAAVPIYHSLPEAPATLYLDFDGHFEAQWGAYSNITTPVYDVDGDSPTFSARELANIAEIWARVSEDFAPFNIDVTTEEPALLAPGVPSSAANGQALRLSIGGQGAWLGTNNDHGGYSYINSFTGSVPNVAYAFVSATQDRPDGLANLISHEAGHAFGLSHQSTYENGVLVQAYSSGGNSWAPLMGHSLFPRTDTTTWHNGTTTSPTTYQDDIAVIARSTNGFGFRPDDHSSSIASATPLSGSGADFVGGGMIGANGDVDMFALTTAEPRNLKVSVTGAAIGRNFDGIVELYDASGTLVATSNPGDSLDAFVVRQLTGTHYVAVKSSGLYGHIGQYTVTVAETTESLARVKITSSSAPYTSSESGRNESVTMMLESRPSADVTFHVSSTDVTEGVLSTNAIVFTPDNWFLPQTVTITGVNDNAPDGDVGYSIVMAPAISADPIYNVADLADLSIVNLDNDAAEYVYWLDSALDLVQRSSPAGENVQTLVDLKAVLGGTSYTPRSLVLDPAAEKMYWTDSTTDSIHRASLDGSSVETVVSGLPEPSGIAIDSVNGKLYWTDPTANKIQRSNLNGTGVEDLVTSGADGALELTLDLGAEKMYWRDGSSFAIRRANLDGSANEVVIAGDSTQIPTSLELDAAAGKVYFSLRVIVDSRPVTSLYRADLDGSNIELLADLDELGGNSISGLTINSVAGSMYWADSISRGVFRASLDGSNLASVIESHSGLADVAILLPRPGINITASGGLTTTEGGGVATFSVSLDAPPTADVVIPVGSSDPTEGMTSVSSLTFTVANWNVPQNVTVTGVDDTVLDGNVSYTIFLGAAASADGRYQGMNAADLAATNTDNDVPQTKFYVVNDASTNHNYEYAASGASVENYTLNSGNAAPRGAASTAAGDKVWVVDANRKVYVYNTSGGLLGSWTAGTLASNATVQGIATNGMDVWIVDARSDKVFKYAGAASRLSGSQSASSSFSLNSGNRNPSDIVTDGTHLWVTNDNSTDKVFKYKVTGGLVGSWTISGGGRPTGITIDPANVSDIWIVDAGTDRVYRYADAAARTSGSQSAADSFVLAEGNTNPQGIADPPDASTMVGDAEDPAETLSSWDLALASLAWDELGSAAVDAWTSPLKGQRLSQVTRSAGRSSLPIYDGMWSLVGAIDKPGDKNGLSQSEHTRNQQLQHIESEHVSDVVQRIFADTELVSLTHMDTPLTIQSGFASNRRT